jgi:hypothetical protein
LSLPPSIFSKRELGALSKERERNNNKIKERG